MALETEVLVNNYNLPPDFAKQLIQFTQGDLEAAIHLIEASEKDIFILKGKFISSKKSCNGALLLFYNQQTNVPEYVFVVVSSDPALARIKIEDSWRVMHESMMKFYTSREANTELSSKIESQLLAPENISYFSIFFTLSGVDIVNLKRFLLNEISKVLIDTNTILKVAREATDVFHFSGFIKTTNVGLKLQPQSQLNLITLLNISVEPVLAPLGGKDVEKIDVGDEILVKVTDTREIVHFLMGFIDTKNVSPGKLFGRVIFNQKTSTSLNNLLILEFAPGIFGRFSIGEKIRVHLRSREEQKQSTGDSYQYEEAKAKESNLSYGSDIVQGYAAYEREDKKSSFLSVFLIIAGCLAAIMLILLWLVS